MKKSLGVKEMIFPNPVLIIGTYDKDGKPNVMNVAWGGIVSGGPESVGIAVRPSRYTFENLKKRKAFTVSIPSAKYMAEADYFGIASGSKENKFEKTGLTPEKAEFVDAPYVKEFPYAIECNVSKSIKIDAHTLFIGEIKDVKIDEDMLLDGDLPDWDKIEPLTFDYAFQEYRLPGKKAGNAFNEGLKFMK